jgi:hypothetical protein
MPAIPEGWRALFPCPPAAPLDQWKYAPYATVVARAEITDARLGYREPRRVALLAPLATGAIDLARMTPFNPDELVHAAAAGATFVPLGDALKGARATKAAEKTLREQALSAARVTVFTNSVLDLVSTPGETRDAFAARCAAGAKARAQDEEAALVRKHDPKIQRLAAQREGARAALAAAEAEAGNGPGVLGQIFGSRKELDRAEARRDRATAKADKARDKMRDTDALLAEAVAERNAAIAAKRAELEQGALAAISAREVAAKKDALTIESYGIAWLAV